MCQESLTNRGFGQLGQEQAVFPEKKESKEGSYYTGAASSHNFIPLILLYSCLSLKAPSY